MSPSPPRRRVPLGILLLLAVELALGVLFLVDRLIENPFHQVHLWADFEHEAAIATWFSSLQLFGVASVLALFSWGIWMKGERDWLLLVLPPLFFLALSADEVIQMHEWFGYEVFSLERRETSVFHYVGIWGFLLGPLALGFLGWSGWRARRYLHDRRLAWRFVVGAVCFVGGAAFVEELANFVERGGTGHMWQVYFEEMGEMLGVTLLLWASWDLLRIHALADVLARLRSEVPGLPMSAVARPVGQLPDRPARQRSAG